ncbi:MAG: fructosamine kinase family protein [Pseudomonadota bacterium]
MQTPDSLIETIEVRLRDAIGNRVDVQNLVALSGGDINRAARVITNHGDYFAKYNSSEFIEMFSAERDALDEIAATGTVRVPQPVATLQSDTCAGLLLEYLPLSNRNPNWSALGERLAQMHSHTADLHGWCRDNTIGATVQINRQTESWSEFWRDSRMTPQLQMAAQNGAPQTLLDAGDELRRKLDQVFASHTPQPSLLHGDLWSGNAGFLEDGTPVIFDPASYFGDSETDLAMSELFGGFEHAFYHAYTSARPADEGYALRKSVYQLYHLLNHFNLFGGMYASRCEQLMRSILRAIRPQI